MVLALPIMWWLLRAAAVGLAALGGAHIGARIVRKTHEMYKFVFEGKRLALLGARGVGKTNLFTFLSTEAVPKKYIQNASIKKVEKNEFHIKDLDFWMEESMDVPGHTKDRADWKKSVESADLVFYLFRADLVKKGDKETIERVKSDISHIARWLQDDDSKGCRLYLVGTHCDKDEEYVNTSDSKRGDYRDSYRSLSQYREIKRRSNFGGGSKLFLGSTDTEEEASKLVYEMLKDASNN